jgi:hypothetical protein
MARLFRALCNRVNTKEKLDKVRYWMKETSSNSHLIVDCIIVFSLFFSYVVEEAAERSLGRIRFF